MFDVQFGLWKFNSSSPSVKCVNNDPLCAKLKDDVKSRNQNIVQGCNDFIPFVETDTCDCGVCVYHNYSAFPH